MVSKRPKVKIVPTESNDGFRATGIRAIADRLDQGRLNLEDRYPRAMAVLRIK